MNFEAMSWRNKVLKLFVSFVAGSPVGVLQQGAILNSAFGREQSEQSWKISVDDVARAKKYGSDGVGSIINTDYGRRASRMSSFLSRRQSQNEENLKDFNVQINKIFED